MRVAQLAALVATLHLATGRADADPTPEPPQAGPELPLVQAPTPPPVPPRANPDVFVHILTPGMTLETSFPRQGEWTFACRTPCDVYVPWNYDYRVTAYGARPTPTFTLESHAGKRIALRADLASSDTWTGGVFLVAAGASTAAVGLVVDFAGFVAAEDCRFSAPSPTGCSVTGSETVGTALLVVGVVAVGVGLGLLMRDRRSQRSRTTSEVGSTQPLRPDVAILRAPVWLRDASLVSVRF
jgi:hypothetical protein